MHIQDEGWRTRSSVAATPCNAATRARHRPSRARDQWQPRDVTRDTAVYASPRDFSRRDALAAEIFLGLGRV